MAIVRLQLKASDAPRMTKDNQHLVLTISRSDLLLWVAEQMPVILIAYDAPTEVAYFELGFVASYGNNSFGFPIVLYEHKNSGASVTLPVRPKEEMMYGGHFLAAEKAVDNFGVADPETFYKLLREVNKKEAQVA